MIKATLAVAAVLALAACGGSDEQPAAPAETAAPAATATEEVPPNNEPLVVRVVGGEPVGGVQQIEVKAGDRVRFVVQADAPEEVHVHGYDISKDVGPGQDARFDFVADLEGIFEIELENSGVQIIELAVEP
jgi:FtsP/CotA-like multicopper oxidase with cupredoxin domain